MQNENISYRLDAFEGPLDLLLSLIAKNKINIYDIPISLIFDQYMEYIVGMDEPDLEYAGEFIDMASKLMLIKSKMLLPRQVVDGREVDPREPLVDALLEYQRAKENAKKLNERFVKYSGRFVKEPDEVGIDRTFVCDHETELLIKAFERIAIRQKDIALSRNDVSRKTLDTILHKKVTPVSERLFYILRYLFRQGGTGFEKLVTLSRERSDIIASFAAILELIKSARIKIVKECEDGDIIIDICRKERAS